MSQLELGRICRNEEVRVQITCGLMIPLSQWQAIPACHSVTETRKEAVGYLSGYVREFRPAILRFFVLWRGETPLVRGHPGEDQVEKTNGFEGVRLPGYRSSASLPSLRTAEGGRV